MKKIFIFLLLVSSFASAQVPALKKHDQNSVIGITGNNNIIKVIQGNDIKIYDVNNSNDISKLLIYLKKIPSLSKNMVDIFHSVSHVDSIGIANNLLLKELLQRTSSGGVLDENALKEELENYKEENNRFKLEILKLKNEILDSGFAFLLKEAYEKINSFDNEGYQKLMEDYKDKLKTHTAADMANYSTASYFQAQNSRNNDKKQKALEQIGQALNYDKDNMIYLYFKASLILELGAQEGYITLCRDTLLNKLSDTAIIEIEPYINTPLPENLASLDNEWPALGYASFSDSRIFRIPIKAVIYNTLGKIYAKRNMSFEAITNLKKSCALLSTPGYDTCTYSADIYFFIGNIYFKDSKADSALIYYKKALDYYHNSTGTSSSTLHQSANNIGIIYYWQYKTDSAIKYFLKGIDDSNFDTLRATPVTTLISNTAFIYQVRRDYANALQYYIQLEALTSTSLGKEHMLTAKAYYKTAKIYMLSGQYKQAELNFIKGADILEKKETDFFEDLPQIYLNLGILYSLMDEKERSLYYLEKIKSLMKWPDKIKAGTISTAEQRLKEKKTDETILICKFALEIFNDLSKAETVSIYKDLGIAYLSNGEKAKAENNFGNALRLLKGPKTRHKRWLLKQIREYQEANKLNKSGALLEDPILQR
jgi:hypothetical protein